MWNMFDKCSNDPPLHGVLRSSPWARRTTERQLGPCPKESTCCFKGSGSKRVKSTCCPCNLNPTCNKSIFIPLHWAAAFSTWPTHANLGSAQKGDAFMPWCWSTFTIVYWKQLQYSESNGTSPNQNALGPTYSALTESILLAGCFQEVPTQSFISPHLLTSWAEILYAMALSASTCNWR